MYYQGDNCEKAEWGDSIHDESVSYIIIVVIHYRGGISEGVTIDLCISIAVGYFCSKRESIIVPMTNEIYNN